MARTTMEIDIPTTLKSMSDLRPKVSIVKMATQEAMKYSVPLQAVRE
jgi:hypothetical protein